MGISFAPKERMKFQEFMMHYDSESACKEAFLANRFQAGVVCKKCGCEEYYWLSTVEQFKCKSCGFRTTLRSGTALEASKLPYRYWLTAMFLMTMTKKSISACDMQRILGHKRYEPIWLMMHKIRRVMGNRDDAHKLSGAIEMDEAFFETVNVLKPDELLKRGRGSQRQSKVLVMAESKEVKNPKKNRKCRKCGYFKMRIMSDLSAESINAEVESAIEPTSNVITDGYRGYNSLKEVVARHKALVCPPSEASRLLPWAHTSIANAKRALLSAYHRINGDYLQNYLDEFCYKLNRRYLAHIMFERLLLAASAAVWYM